MVLTIFYQCHIYFQRCEVPNSTSEISNAFRFIMEVKADVNVMHYTSLTDVWQDSLRSWCVWHLNLKLHLASSTTTPVISCSASPIVLLQVLRRIVREYTNWVNDNAVKCWSLNTSVWNLNFYYKRRDIHFKCVHNSCIASWTAADHSWEGVFWNTFGTLRTAVC